jgi:hypothetical protein
MNFNAMRIVIPLVALLSGLSGCAVTEDSLRASSETLHNTSEASSDFTSSTSHEDDKDQRHRDVHDFAARNFDMLRQNAAVGKGAYLNSLAELMGVPVQAQAQFQAQAKAHFVQLYDRPDVDVDTLLARMDKYVMPNSKVKSQY